MSDDNEARLDRAVDKLAGAMASVQEALKECHVVMSTIHGASIDPHTDNDVRLFSYSKYDWEALEGEAGKFFHPGVTQADRLRLARSLSALANKRYGPGKVAVRRGRAGVWVVRKGKWTSD